MDTQTRRAADADTRPAEPLSYLDARPERGRPPGWMKITVLILAIVVLLVVAMMLLGGGHNPMQHF